MITFCAASLRCFGRRKTDSFTLLLASAYLHSTPHSQREQQHKDDVSKQLKERFGTAIESRSMAGGPTSGIYSNDNLPTSTAIETDTETEHSQPQLVTLKIASRTPVGTPSVSPSSLQPPAQILDTDKKLNKCKVHWSPSTTSTKPTHFGSWSSPRKPHGPYLRRHSPPSVPWSRRRWSKRSLFFSRYSSPRSSKSSVRSSRSSSSRGGSIVLHLPQVIITGPSGSQGSQPSITSSSSSNRSSLNDAKAAWVLSELHGPLPPEDQMSNNTAVVTNQPGASASEAAKIGKSPKRQEQNDPLIEFLNCVFVTACCPFVVASIPIICPKDYERTVVFRLGKLRRGGAVGPGVSFINPCFDNYQTIDMRVEVVDIRPQEVITKDAVSILVDAVVFYRVKDAVSSCCDVHDFREATVKMSESTLRSVLGKFSLSDLLERRTDITEDVENTLAEATSKWGVVVENLEIKNINLPIDMVRSMSTEAETRMLALAKVVQAKGEEMSASYLSQASDCMADPAAVTLRSLKELISIAQDAKTTTLIPVPFPEGFWNWDV